MIPVWLLDVDGVVNCDRPSWGGPPARGDARTAGFWWRMRWAPELTAAIRALHDEGLVEVRWCSTWCGDTDQLAGLFGLPGLADAFPMVEFLPSVRDAKLAAAMAVVAEGRRLVWTDDDAIPTHGPELAVLQAKGALLLRVDPRRGLTPRDVDAVRAWL